MTDVELQKAVVEDLRAFLKSRGIQFMLYDILADMKVYAQDLPVKRDEDDEDIRNYVVVAIGDEDVEDDLWKVELHFDVCIEDREGNGTGNIHVLYLMNEIYLHFIKQGITGRHYFMEKEAHKRLNFERMHPYYEGDLITYWKLPLPKEEGLEDLI